MATYTIQVLNQSGFQKDYVIFSEPPKVTQSGTVVQVFSNAWVTFPQILNGSYDKLIYEDVTEAYWGTLPSSPASGVTVNQGGSAITNTETGDGVVFSGSTPLGFGPVVPGAASTTGAFQIKANSDFTAKANFVFGMSKASNTPIPSPVATFLAQPNDTFEIIPVVTFYVADGYFEQGAIIDVKAFSTVSAEIDFTGRPQTTATVVQGDNGTFTVQYSH